MSAPHFFSHPAFAVIDREDVRDVAVFNPDVTEKLQTGKTIVVGTCSPRREEMAAVFLKKALPQLHDTVRIEIRPIRGNVESRLEQLHEGKYDATILATAGLNRFLRSETEAHLPITSGPSVRELLKNKLLMLLPLFECVPAPCQGAIVAEADPSNPEAVRFLQLINDQQLYAETVAEKKRAYQYGTGCLQKFGVATIYSHQQSYLYAAGEDSKGKRFTEWANLPAAIDQQSILFSSTDCMKDFFSYEWKQDIPRIEQSIVFVANYKSLLQETIKLVLTQKQVWASGTKTWFELAKLGIWVQGSADALGFETLLPVLQLPLFEIQTNDICILSHEKAADRWRKKGYHAVSNYRLYPSNDVWIQRQIAAATHLFWSSFAQYESYGHFAATDAVHLCAGGETAVQLMSRGIQPVIFPTIKSFEHWRKLNIPSHSVA